MTSECIADSCHATADVFALIVHASGELSERSFCRTHAGLLELVPEDMHGPYFRSNKVSGVFEECRLRAVIFENDAEAYTIVLRSTSSPSALVFPTGYAEASWIWGYARQHSHSTPSTHELLAHIVGEFGGEFQEGVLFDYRSDRDAYECILKIRRDGVKLSIPCRISDLISLSYCTEFPIRVDSSFLVRDPITLG